ERRSGSCRRWPSARRTRTGAPCSPPCATARACSWSRGAGGALLGTAQLDLCTRPNGRHRAEVVKVIVHTKARRRGIGRALMLALEDEARRQGRGTLVLDTRRGDPAERLYAGVGYTLAGVIPAYARS